MKLKTRNSIVVVVVIFCIATVRFYRRSRPALESLFRRCANEKVKLLLISPDLSRESNRGRPLEWNHLAIFGDQVRILENMLDERDLALRGESPLRTHKMWGVEKRKRKGKGTTSASASKYLIGFVVDDFAGNPINVSVIYERRNRNGGYFWMPWSHKGVPMAFPSFKTRPIAVEGFDGTFHTPANVSHFEWELEAAEFIPCDLERQAEFARSVDEPVTLNWKKDAKRIQRSMGLIVALRKTMAQWRKRNFIFYGTLLGWFRQCSIIPHDRDVDSAQFIEEFEPWMFDYFRNHPVLQIRSKLGLPHDSLEFQLGTTKGPQIDLFWLYRKGNQSWTGFQISDEKHTKITTIMPAVERICTGEMHGYIFYVPCDAFSVISSTYGDAYWFVNKAFAVFNNKPNGTWTDKEVEEGEVYKYFPWGQM